MQRPEGRTKTGTVQARNEGRGALPSMKEERRRERCITQPEWALWGWRRSGFHLKCKQSHWKVLARPGSLGAAGAGSLAAWLGEAFTLLLSQVAPGCPGPPHTRG